jgi:hypothetical protein
MSKRIFGERLGEFLSDCIFVETLMLAGFFERLARRSGINITEPITAATITSS